MKPEVMSSRENMSEADATVSMRDVSMREVLKREGLVREGLVHEVQVVRAACGVVVRDDRAVLRVSGADAVDFLQRMVTQDLRKLEVGSSLAAALLVVKGQMVAEFVLHRRADDVLLETARETAEIVRAALDRYIIADDVTLAPLYSVEGGGEGNGAGGDEMGGDTTVGDATVGDKRVRLATLAGERVGEVVGRFAAGLNENGNAMAKVIDGAPEVMFARRSLGGLDAVTLVCDAASFDAVLEALVGAAREVGGDVVLAGALEVVRIANGVAVWGRELTEKTLLPEAGLGEAISYTKGCYVGQEPMARIHARGHVNRHLMRLRVVATGDAWGRGSGDVSGDASGTLAHVAEAVQRAPGEVVVLTGEGLAEKEVGYLTSAATDPSTGEVVALGYLRREVLADGAGGAAQLRLYGFDPSPAVVVVGYAGVPMGTQYKS